MERIKRVMRPYAAALAALPILLTASCAKKQAAAFQRPPANVTVAVASVRDVPVTLEEIGKTVAREVVSVMPQVGGKIDAIQFADGADVKKGDLLFKIDDQPYRAALGSAQANLQRAKAVLDLAKTEYARVARLVETEIMARADFDTKKNAVQVAEAEVRQAEAAAETARINVGYCEIRSPIDGRAGKRLVDRGNVVKANETPLLVIQRIDPIYVDFTVTEGDLSRVQRHMLGRALPVEIQVPDDPAPALPGEVTFLDNAVQEGTGTVTLRATVANPRRALWPGRFVKVRLVLETLSKAVVVPAVAPQMSAKGPFVYVVKEDDTAELRPVKPGQRQGDVVVLESGVKAGEKVIVNGQLGVTPGGKVKIEEAAKPEAQAAAAKAS
jgi:multidrug efflux system membrane fusion protein